MSLKDYEFKMSELGVYNRKKDKVVSSYYIKNALRKLHKITFKYEKELGSRAYELMEDINNIFGDWEK